MALGVAARRKSCTTYTLHTTERRTRPLPDDDAPELLLHADRMAGRMLLDLIPQEIVNRVPRISVRRGNPSNSSAYSTLGSEVEDGRRRFPKTPAGVPAGLRACGPNDGPSRGASDSYHSWRLSARRSAHPPPPGCDRQPRARRDTAYRRTRAPVGILLRRAAKIRTAAHAERAYAIDRRQRELPVGCGGSYGLWQQAEPLVMPNCIDADASTLRELPDLQSLSHIKHDKAKSPPRP